MRRHLLGLITLALLAWAAVATCYLPLRDYEPAGKIALRIGLVLGVLWLAWPDLHRLPGWAWCVLPIGLVVLIYAKSLLVYLIPLFAVTTTFYILYRKFWRS